MWAVIKAKTKQEDWGKHLVLPTGTADAINQVGDYADRILYKSVPAYGEQENKDGQNTGVSIGTPGDIQELWRRTRDDSKTGECAFRMRMMKIKTAALSGVPFIRQQTKRKNTNTKLKIYNNAKM